MITCKDNLGNTVSLPKERFRTRISVYGVIRHVDRICICRSPSGKLWFPGGEIEAGETKEDALLREIDEETGLTNVSIGQPLQSLESFFYFEPTDDAMHAFLHFYTCTVQDHRFPKERLWIDDEEKTLEWIDPAALQENDFANLGREILTMMRV